MCCRWLCLGAGCVYLRTDYGLRVQPTELRGEQESRDQPGKLNVCFTLLWGSEHIYKVNKRYPNYAFCFRVTGHQQKSGRTPQDSEYACRKILMKQIHSRQKSDKMKFHMDLARIMDDRCHSGEQVN